MKRILLLALFTFSMSTFALPILNESVATNSIYTIYPDHKDNNLYYISPNFMSIALDTDGTPLFNYTEFKVGWRKRKHATIQMIMIVNNYTEELNKAKDTILSHNPNARFALVPFTYSKLVFSDKFKGMLKSHACTHISAEYSAEQSCILNLSPFGRRVFINNIKKRLTLVMNFIYKIKGVDRMADDSFTDTTREFQIAGRVGGDKLIHYPELFTDYKGRIIDL